MKRIKIGIRQITTLLAISLSFFIGYSSSALAYDVENDSTANTVYMLLLNDNPGAVFHSITIGSSVPAFVAGASASIVPPNVLGGASDLAALEFNVIPSAVVGSTGDLLVTVSGLAAGTPVSIEFIVPLEVVASAPAAQGVVGSNLPAPDPGGVDTDGDGVTDALEQAFGSDPSSSSSLPGDGSTPPVSENIPILTLPAYALLAALLIGLGAPVLRQRQRKETK